MKALIIALLLSASVAPEFALAQMDRAAHRAIVTDLGINVTNATSGVMSPSEVVSIVRGSARLSVSESLSGLADATIKEHIAGSTDILRSGGSVHFSTTVNAKERITEQRSVNVRVSYEARPIGGILNVRVELLPLFAGIGAASRADMSRDFAQAVDGVDDAAVSETVLRLTHELATDYASKM